jgi:hypothetical protein
MLLGKIEGMRPLRRPRHRWVDNIKTVLRLQVGRVRTKFIRLRRGLQ